ncbi:MAG: hypothetical protein SXA11_23995 [Cyanobacteriota bacterium]|nr:hypothetical protein [Cyanobacteriota bacterium]
MSQQTSYSISVEERDIVVRFNRSCIDMDALGRFLDYVELEAMLHPQGFANAKRSKLTEEQAAAFAEEIDWDVWKEIKQNFLGE